MRNHLYIVNADIRHIHRQDALCLHLLVIEFIYVVETHIAVGLAVNESYAYRIFIGCDGSKDEFFARISLEYPASLSLQKLCH